MCIMCKNTSKTHLKKINTQVEKPRLRGIFIFSIQSTTNYIITQQISLYIFQFKIIII